MTPSETLTAEQRSDPKQLRADIVALIGNDLAKAMSIYDQELQSNSPAVADILAHTARFRGKQLRPTLLLLTAEAVGGINKSHHVLAAVIEMVHVATLLHDDVLDEADVRRHVVTVNRRWNNESSVLFGDFLFTHAFHLAASLGSTLACRRIGDASNKLCEGELTQINHRGDFELDEATYLKIIDGKTAELCAVAAELGARYSSANDHIVRACSQFGRNLGIAFQIADDLLDLVGQQTETGKTLGTDLEKQKPTLPLIHMLRTLNATEQKHVRALLESPDKNTRAAIDTYLEKTESIAYAAHTAQKFVTQAQRSLDQLEDSQAKTLLSNIAELAANRTA